MRVERLKLHIVGAEEDVPRLLLASGKACGGSVVFAMRPLDNQVLLVHRMKTEVRLWQHLKGRAPTALPSQVVDTAFAVAEVKAMRQKLPAAGPGVLRGEWQGYFLCEDGKPIAFLQRKVASYGVLRIASEAGRWSVDFKTEARWFTSEKVQTGKADTLEEAITLGISLATQLVQKACLVRDTVQRAKVDYTYAAAHPAKVRAPKEPKSPERVLGEGRTASPPASPCKKGCSHHKQGAPQAPKPSARPSKPPSAKGKAAKDQAIMEAVVAGLQGPKGQLSLGV